MGSLKSFTILLALGAWGAAAKGSPPEDAPPPGPSPASARPEPPVPPGEYVKAAAWLIQSGDMNQAASYLQAADDYRDRLTPQEQATLDALKARQSAAASSPPAVAGPAAVETAEDSVRRTASSLVVQAREALRQGRPDEARRLARQAEGMGATFATGEDSPARVLAEMAGPAAPAAAPARGGLGDDKQAARWMLQQAREMAAQGHHDEALKKVAEARAMNVRWTLFDETPAKVEELIRKSRPAAAAATGDRRQAKSKLKDARAALANGQTEQAEGLAREVAAWNLRYTMLDDNPEKVLAAVRAVQRRDAMRKGGVGAGLGQDVYKMLVEEARSALNQGQLEIAEAKAQQAHRMNVAVPVTADRAEAVLHDIVMARARGQAGDAPSVAAERQANELLAAGQRDDATAKFLEAERLRAAETITPSSTDPAVTPAQVELTTAPAPTLTLEPAGSGPLPQPAPAPVATNEGQTLLDQSAALMAAGNMEQARQTAERARQGGYGVEARADETIAQIALSQQGGALKIYEAALDSMRKGDVDRARALLGEVAVMENQDESLMQKVQDLLARMPGDQPGVATLGAVEDVATVNAQKLNVEVGTKVAEARRLLETDPERAIELLESTLKAIDASEVNPTAAKTMTRRVEVAIELAKKDKSAFDEKMKDKAFRAEIETKRLRILEADKAKQQQVGELMAKSKEAEGRGELAEAEQLARRAAEIDPNNVAATAQATVMRMKRHYDREKGIRDDMSEAALEAFQQVSEAGIADPELQRRGIVHPKDFAELTRRRADLADRLSVKKAPEVLAIEAKLNEPIELNFEQEQPLGEVLNYLASYTGLNITPDQRALGEEGLTLNTPVSLKAKDVKLKTALKLLLQPLGLTYKVEDNVLLITNPQASRLQTYAKAYPVADLVISPHKQKKNQGMPAGMGGINPDNPNNLLGSPVSAPLGQGTADPGAVLGAQPTTDNPSGRGWGTGERQLSMEDFQPLIDLIRASVAPGTWRDTPDMVSSGYGLGGGFGGDQGANGTEAVGSITPFFLNISLIIRHTSEVHDDIVDLLRQLRRLQDLQVSVEVRFITVNDSFFEQIGVDFDFAIQSDVVGKKSSFAIPNPTAVPGGATTGGTAGTAGQTAGVVPYLINPARDHSLGARQPLVVGTNGPTGSITNPSFEPGLQIPFLQSTSSAITPFNATATGAAATFGMAFLSDLEVYLFLTAIQGDIRNNLVQAPKVTTFNGAPAFVFNVTSRAYVASLTPIVGAGAVAFQPTIGQFPDGVQLFVTPVVSADRRYVRMTLSPVFTTLIDFQNFVVPAAVGGGGLGGGATSINGQVTLPQFALTSVSTTVTVPDGGTVLLGGVKRLREQRSEFGVPVLSKTPLINRLFRNIGIGRTTDSLMLMVTPRIIILEEEEQRLGIPAVQNVTF